MTLHPLTGGRNMALLGIGLMLLSVFVFALNNALGKWLIATLPVGQFLFLRSVAALTLLGPFYWRGGIAAFRDAPRKPLQIARMVLSAIEIAAFYLAVSYLPLADTMTFWLAAPIYVTALSAIFLGEKVGWRRWTAVLIGFIGVLLAVRPSAATLTWPALIGLGGGVLYAFVILATRSLRNTPDAVLISGPLVGSMVFGITMLPLGWVTPRLVDVAAFIVVAIFFLIGALCSNRSLKVAPASVVVPFQYTMIVWGVLLGYFVFGEIPEPLTLVGAAIITGAGIYIFMREQAVARRAPAPMEPQ